MKVLNLYSGVGGNRKFWEGHEITAVELNPRISEIYQDFYPEDNVIVGDAHQYLLDNFKEYDFIWASPPCPTHSRLRTMNKTIVYPDMGLYQEIILLKKWFKGGFVIENVIPYYDPLIEPDFEMARHYFWCNFEVTPRDFKKMKTCKIHNEREYLQKEFGFNLDKYSGIDKRKVLRNCVIPELGKHILDCFINKDSLEFEQLSLF